MKLPAILNEKVLNRALLGVGVYFAIVKPVLTKLNVIDTKEEKEAKKREEASRLEVESGSHESPYSWAAFFSKAPKGVLIMSSESAAAKARKIWGSYNYFNFFDQYDESAIFAVLESVKTQSQFAWVCKKFFELYSTSLHSFLLNALTKNEFTQFNLKLTQKPKYKV